MIRSILSSSTPPCRAAQKAYALAGKCHTGFQSEIPKDLPSPTSLREKKKMDKNLRQFIEIKLEFPEGKLPQKEWKKFSL